MKDPSLLVQTFSEQFEKSFHNSIDLSIAFGLYQYYLVTTQNDNQSEDWMIYNLLPV